MEALLIFGLLFFVSVCWIFHPSKSASHEPVLPDESEVIGKDLPVGFRFVKDGRVVEVVEDEFICTGCVYLKESNFNGCEHPDSVCSSRKRATNDSVVFKYIDHE